jgi:hypothetical protein
MPNPQSTCVVRLMTVEISSSGKAAGRQSWPLTSHCHETCQWSALSRPQLSLHTVARTLSASILAMMCGHVCVALPSYRISILIYHPHSTVRCGGSTRQTAPWTRSRLGQTCGTWIYAGVCLCPDCQVPGDRKENGGVASRYHMTDQVVIEWINIEIIKGWLAASCRVI